MDHAQTFTAKARESLRAGAAHEHERLAPLTSTTHPLFGIEQGSARAEGYKVGSFGAQFMPDAEPDAFAPAWRASSPAAARSSPSAFASRSTASTASTAPAGSGSTSTPDSTGNSPRSCHHSDAYADFAGDFAEQMEKVAASFEDLRSTYRGFQGDAGGFWSDLPSAATDTSWGKHQPPPPRPSSSSTHRPDSSTYRPRPLYPERKLTKVEADALRLRQQRLQEHEDKWQRFTEAVQAGTLREITLSSIPFPDPQWMTLRSVCPERAGGGWGALEARKAALRGLHRRWHPDKFQQQFGHCIVPADRAAVAARVNALAQHLNALATQLHASM